jgi:hypothetical protein
VVGDGIGASVDGGVCHPVRDAVDFVSHLSSSLDACLQCLRERF